MLIIHHLGKIVKLHALIGMVNLLEGVLFVLIKSKWHLSILAIGFPY